MKLYIKYMVSLRCKMLVTEILKNLNIKIITVDLGMAEVVPDVTPSEIKTLRYELARSGLELLDDKKAILIEKIKTIIIEMIHYSEDYPKVNFSTYLSEVLNLDYNYIASIFSEVKGITIEYYIITNKIERAKELLLYNELSLTEISYLLQYSSVAHLSNQFKKITGLTPSFFKQLAQNRKRISLEDL
jgi:YesN/AraC family two-component response regulator